MTVEVTELPLLRNSERQSYTQCRQKWDWEFNDRIKPIDEMPALKFGDLVHQALAAYYKKGKKRGPHPARTFERLYAERVDAEYAMGFKDEEGEWHNAGDLGVSMLENYYNKYHEHDKRFKVLSSEQTFYVPLKVSIPGHGTVRFRFVGTVDGVWVDMETDSDPFFAEHKTTKAINTDGLDLDEQAGSYWTYAPKWMWRNGFLPDGVYPKYVYYNFLRKAVPNPDKACDDQGRVLNKPTKPALVAKANELDLDSSGTMDKITDRLLAAGVDVPQLGEISKAQPSPYWHRQKVYRDQVDRERVHDRVIQQFTEMFLIRQGHPLFKIYKVPGPLHSPNCRGCPFKDMCVLHEGGHDWEAYRDASMQRWDPYDAHERVERR